MKNYEFINLYFNVSVDDQLKKLDEEVEELKEAIRNFNEGKDIKEKIGLEGNDVMHTINSLLNMFFLTSDQKKLNYKHNEKIIFRLRTGYYDKELKKDDGR